MKNETPIRKTQLERYLSAKELPYFRSEPFKIVQTFTKEEAKEGLNPDLIKFVEQDLNKENFENYIKFLRDYKKNYDEIFAGLQNPDDKRGLKERVCSVLTEPTKNPDYLYLGLVTDLLKQIKLEYDLYIVALKSDVSERRQPAKKTFFDFIDNVKNKEAFAKDLRDKFKTEKGIDFKIMIDLLKEESIILIGSREFSNFYKEIKSLFDRNIGTYQSLNDSYKDKDYKEEDLIVIQTKLKPLVDKHKA